MAPRVTDYEHVSRRSLVLIAAVAFVLSAAMPAIGGPSITKQVKKALGLAKKADKRSKRALKLAAMPGPIGPVGPKGDKGDSVPLSEEPIVVPESALGGGWEYPSEENPLRYWKDGTGTVHLDGVVAGGGDLTTIFTLPAGYRPSQRWLHFPVYSQDELGNVIAAGVRVCGLACGAYDGEIVRIGGDDFFFTLDGVNFDAR
jgi:hypothetical protein